ncbi:MAG: spiro-SPASM protein [Treponema sp.]|nr:spiro-SPASM protein [Treponema sp.]
MKSIVVLFDEKNKYENEKVFGGKSAVELCNQAASSLGYTVKTISGLSDVSSLFENLNQICRENDSQSVIFSYADCPFLNKELTQELLDTHFEYKAEYTFAEGYPAGFAPEVLDSGTVAILSELAKTTAAQEGKKKISRKSVYELIKTDINSFEVETVLAPVDWRLLRFNFDCAKKENLLACTKLFELTQGKGSAAELSKTAAECNEILKTVPAFYNLQLAQKCQGKCTYCPYPAALKAAFGIAPQDAQAVMDTQKAISLIDQISQYSGEAVVGLSAWGECFNHPDLYKIIEKILSYEGLSVFIEADGNSIPQDFAQKAAELVNKAAERTNGWPKLMFVVSMDGFTEKTCKSLRGDQFDLQKAVNAVQALEKELPGCIFPQFVRMNANEAELEGFFRYWNEKSNASGGNFIIQKHNNFAGLLKNEEPADLSPLERNPCWHIRREMTILCNGDSPVCYCRVLGNIAGNVFDQGIDAVWKKYDKELGCGGCDEFYTFNF